MLEYSMTYRICQRMQKKKKSQHIKLVSIYALEINWFIIIHDIELIHATHIFLFIKIFFIFNIHLYLINKFRVNIKFLKQKCFAKRIIKWL
jgi:hypothetical protein